MRSLALLVTLSYGALYYLRRYAVLLPIPGFSMLSAVEYTLQARQSNLDSRILPNRWFGILYLCLAAASCVVALRF
jgi:hypothetical protein